MPSVFYSLFQRFRNLISTLEQAFFDLSQLTHYSIPLSTVTDLPRSKTQLIAENALLRQQLITLRVNPQIKKTQFT